MTGKSGLITTPNGLRIACLGGIYDPETYSTSEAAPVRLASLSVLFYSSVLGLRLTLLCRTNDGASPLEHSGLLQHETELQISRCDPVRLIIVPARRYPHFKRLARGHTSAISSATSSQRSGNIGSMCATFGRCYTASATSVPLQHWRGPDTNLLGA